MNSHSPEMERSIRSGLRSMPDVRRCDQTRARQWVLARAGQQTQLPADPGETARWVTGIGRGLQLIRRGLTLFTLEAAAFERANTVHHAMLIRRDVPLRVGHPWGSLRFGMTVAVY